MHLKSITLKGFKSFPDRTRLEFTPGVSVIVGPNGSGKSNVTDAVLWALGEQSPLAVRGQSMQDVIFAGARGQQGRRAAEVELVIDDANRELGSEFTELSIVRRLERSGEGEYRINGARCRLIDVIEVLSDTGLGKEMHSVVSQGRVESVISSKPRDRRLLIEEAAGLGKHRKRRRRAQLKLARTQDNLDRALDVEREARSRLRPLKRQAEAAELHARLERQALEARWELARDSARARRAALAEAERAATAARERRDEIDRALGEVATRREDAEQALANRADQREELTRRLFDARATGERVALRGDQARAAAAAADERAATARQRLAALEADATGDTSGGEDGSLIAELEAELARLDTERHAALDEQLAPLEREREEAASAAAAARARMEGLRGELAAAEERCEAERSARAAAERAAESARSEAARLAAELSAAEQFLRSRAEAHHGGDERALADQLDVDPGYEAALAAALGGRLGAAVVADLAAGSTLLDRSGADGGSALVSGGALDAGVAGDPPLPEAERLIEHVRGSHELMALVRSLLADTWVVPDLAALPAGFAGTAVTRGGRAWLGAWRELRQIAEGGEERVLAERNRRDELSAGSEAAVAAQRETADALERAIAAVGAADAQREYADRSLRAAARERDETAERERRAGWLIEQRRGAPDEGPSALRRAQVEGALAAERRVADRAERARQDRATEIDDQRRALLRDESLAPAARELAASLKEVAVELAARASALDAELTGDRAGGEEVAAELRACAQREAELQAELRERGDAVTGTEVAAQQARDQAAEIDAELRELAARLELAAEPAEQALDDEERASLQQRIERLARRRELLGPVNPLAKDEYAEAREYVEELERQRHDLEAALRELEGLITETDRRIREAFESTFAAAAKNFEEVVEQLFPGGRGQLRLVREDAGPRPVLGGQPLNGDGSDTDADDDDAAAEPEEDRLGVEIEMTPAGKAMKRLSLLSGGEKSLTALAFLFAVFLARPCPFYVLDEVEAALDDLNIDRFLTLLRRYSQRAQFIVVTHQKRTMEAADTLYGVSMGDDGVSKVISRRLPREEPADAAAPAA